MAEITAAAVKALRDKTQLPMMECKKALAETGGDEEAAIRLLREQGKKTMASRAGRSTEQGRLAIHISEDPPAGAIIELQCESAQVAQHEEFAQLANDLAKQLATGPGAATPEELLAQRSPSKDGTLQEQWDELANRIREVFRLQRLKRVAGTCGGYVHHNQADAVLLQCEGGDQQLAKEVSMHIAAMNPQAVKIEDLDPAEVKKERAILTEAARQEGKPENIIEKMVEGRMRNYYAETVLYEQPYVRDDKQTVGKICQAGGMDVQDFTHWRLGEQ